MIKSKKGGEKVLSIWWFFCLAFVGAGIIIGVLMFYSAEMNVNNLEADTLANRIADCISDNGYLKEMQNFDVYKECKLNERFDETHFFRVSFYNQDSSQKATQHTPQQAILVLTSAFSGGAPREVISQISKPIEDLMGKSTSLENICKAEAGLNKALNFPRCIKRVYYLHYESVFKIEGTDVPISDDVAVWITAVSNQQGERVSI
jgi:hypothetical protein